MHIRFPLIVTEGKPHAVLECKESRVEGHGRVRSRGIEVGG